MDFTGAQMILTLKLISTAVSYQDGLLAPAVLPPTLQFQSQHICSHFHLR